MNVLESKGIPKPLAHDLYTYCLEAYLVDFENPEAFSLYALRQVGNKLKENVPIKKCAEKGWVKTMRVLVENGVDPTARNNDAIRWASAHGHLNVVKYLMSLRSLGWNIDPTADDNWAIRLARNYGHYEVVTYLTSCLNN